MTPGYRQRSITPFFLIICIGIVLAMGRWLRVGQNFYAWFILVVFFCLTWIDLTFSFLTLLFLTQCFTGDFYRPYMFLIDALGLIFAGITFLKAVFRREKIEIPFWWVILPYLLVVLLSIPMNAKEILLYIKVWGLGHYFREIGVTDTFGYAFYLRELGWELISLFTLIAVFNHLIRYHSDCEKRIWVTLAAALVIYAVIGLLLLYSWIPYEGRFLSMNFSNSLYFKGMLTSYGWSVSFFAEYFAATFPFLLFFLITVHGKYKKAAVIVLIMVSVFAALKTFRRAVWIVGTLEVAAGFFFYLSINRNQNANSASSGRREWKAFVAGLVIVFLGFFLFVWVWNTGKIGEKARNRIQEKFSYEGVREDPRWAIHRLCLHMWVHEPVLGLGAGGYTQNFYRLGGGKYLNSFNVRFPDGRVLNKLQGSPHSTYLTILVERGTLGFLSFLWLVGVFLYAGFKAFGAAKGQKKIFLAAVLTTLSGMLLYAFFMDIFWVPGVRMLFWCYLGILAALSYQVLPRVSFKRKTTILIVLAFVALLGYRLVKVWNEPFDSHFESGFYRWKFSRPGEKGKFMYRFTSGRALKVLTVRGEALCIQVCSNKPYVEKNPQVLFIYLNGKRVKEVRLRDKAWKDIVIPVNGLKGKKVFIGFRVLGTWVPYRYGRGGSKKELGVIIRKIKQISYIR